MAIFQLFFQCGSPTGPDLENRVSDQDTGSPGRPISSGLQVPGEPGHCARTRAPCNSAHEQTPLSNDTIDSVLRHREVGRAKDLSASRRTYPQHPLVTSLIMG
jgi:hypothetical protein